jgi:hypothetical protein
LANKDARRRLRGTGQVPPGLRRGRQARRGRFEIGYIFARRCWHPCGSGAQKRERQSSDRDLHGRFFPQSDRCHREPIPSSQEALVKEGHHKAIVETNGDGTIRTRIPDIARQIPWPRGFTARIRRNKFTDRWHDREELLEQNITVEGPRYRQAFMDGDPDNTAVWFGEAAGLIESIEPAAVIIEKMVAEATHQLRTYN